VKAAHKDGPRLACFAWLGFPCVVILSETPHEKYHRAETKDANQTELDRMPRISHTAANDPPVKLVGMSLGLAYPVSANALCPESGCHADDEEYPRDQVSPESNAP